MLMNNEHRLTRTPVLDKVAGTPIPECSSQCWVLHQIYQGMEAVALPVLQANVINAVAAAQQR